jgi:2'-5' RNA ligase
MTRTFIALEMNEHLQRHLEEVISRVALALPTARWVDPASIHLTLAFLGELTADRVEEAVQATESSARQCKSFSYTLSPLGIFGDVRHPRVIWMGVHEPTGSLTHLHAALSRELERRGFEVEKRPFLPHLTLARVKAPLSAQEQQKLQELLNGDQGSVVPLERYEVRRVQVIKSELQRTGAQYMPLHASPLGG